MGKALAATPDNPSLSLLSRTHRWKERTDLENCLQTSMMEAKTHTQIQNRTAQTNERLPESILMGVAWIFTKISQLGAGEMAQWSRGSLSQHVL